MHTNFISFWTESRECITPKNLIGTCVHYTECRKIFDFINTIGRALTKSYEDDYEARDCSTETEKVSSTLHLWTALIPISLVIKI